MNDNDTLENAEDTMPVTDTDVETEFGGDDDEVETPEVAAETPVAAEPKKRGPKSIWERENGVETALKAIHAGAAQEGDTMPSRFIQKQLANAGLVEFVPVKTPGTLGRPKLVAFLTAAGLVRVG